MRERLFDRTFGQYNHELAYARDLYPLQWHLLCFAKDLKRVRMFGYQRHTSGKVFALRIGGAKPIL